MAKNEKNTNGTMSLGEISTIRNILMGDQMSNYETQFNEIEAKFQQSSDATNKALTELKSEHARLISDLEKSVNQRMDELEKAMNAKFEAMSKQLDSTSRSDKHTIGKLLQSMSEKLLKE